MTLRRGFVIAGLALVLGASPAAGQSSSRIPRIGYMSADSGPNPLSEALLRGLSERGWVEGQSIVIEYRWAAGRPDRYPVLAAELVGLRVDLIVAGGGTPGALAAQRATSVIPIVTPITGDPVGALDAAKRARADALIVLRPPSSTRSGCVWSTWSQDRDCRRCTSTGCS